MFRETKPKLKEKAYIGPTDCSSICHLTLATKSEKWLKMKKLSDEWLGAPGTNLMYLTFFKKECHNCPADNLDKCHMSFDILQPVIAQCGNLALLNSLHGLNQPTRPYSWLNELPSILFQKLEKKTQQPPPPAMLTSDSILSSTLASFSLRCFGKNPKQISHLLQRRSNRGSSRILSAAHSWHPDTTGSNPTVRCMAP